MKELYRRFFYVPKHAKVTENTLQVRIALAVVSIVFCLAMMSMSAYAFFTASVSSSTNVIQAATFFTHTDSPEQAAYDGEYYVIDNRPSLLTFTKDVTDEETGEVTQKTSYAVEQRDELFDFVLTNMGTATSGYCRIVILTDADDFTTPQIAYTETFGTTTTVTLEVPTGNVAMIKFMPEWGTCSYPAFLSMGPLLPEYGTPVIPEMPEMPEVSENPEVSEDSEVSEELEMPAETEDADGAEDTEEAGDSEGAEEPADTEPPADSELPAENEPPADSELPADNGQPAVTEPSDSIDEPAVPDEPPAEETPQTEVTEKIVS